MGQLGDLAEMALSDPSNEDLRQRLQGVLGEAQAMAGKLGPLAKTGAWGVNKVSVCACAMNVKEAVPRCVITGPCWSRRELMQTLYRLDCSANCTERPSRPLSGKCFLWTCCRMMRQRRRVFDGWSVQWHWCAVVLVPHEPEGRRVCGQDSSCLGLCAVSSVCFHQPRRGFDEGRHTGAVD